MTPPLRYLAAGVALGPGAFALGVACSGWPLDRDGAAFAAAVALVSGFALLAVHAALVQPNRWEPLMFGTAVVGLAASGAMSPGLQESNWSAALAIGCSWVVPWCWVTALRLARCPTAAAVGMLLVSGLLCASPWLVGPSIEGGLPPWALEWNPLVRLLGGVFGHDWFRGPSLYRQVGESYFRYPDLSAAWVGPVLSAVGALALASSLHWARFRRASPDTLGHVSGG